MGDQNLSLDVQVSGRHISAGAGGAPDGRCRRPISTAENRRSERAIFTFSRLKEDGGEGRITISTGEHMIKGRYFGVGQKGRRAGEKEREA